MNIKDKLLSYKNKTIKIEDIYKLIGYMEYEDFVEIINTCIEDKILEPIKSSRTNGRRPALYNKYRILKESIDYSAVLEDIKLLHPTFNHTKYKENPENYLKYKKEIDLLSKFLWKNGSSLKTPMSINERSFQIWGKEKFLKDSSVVKSIFQYNDWDLRLLNYYETPEPFFEYIFSSEKNMNILIVENKDTWFSLRKIMREDKLNYLYRYYNVLLYGEGKKIIRKSGRLVEYDKLLSGSNNKYFYFGDLDYEGIDIYQTLIKYNSELNINLCTELYLLMLKESSKFNLPKMKKGQKKIDISLFLKNFKEDEVKVIVNILENGFYIPQEILNYPLFKFKMKEGFNDV